MQTCGYVPSFKTLDSIACEIHHQWRLWNVCRRRKEYLWPVLWDKQALRPQQQPPALRPRRRGRRTKRRWAWGLLYVGTWHGFDILQAGCIKTRRYGNKQCQQNNHSGFWGRCWKLQPRVLLIFKWDCEVGQVVSVTLKSMLAPRWSWFNLWLGATFILNSLTFYSGWMVGLNAGWRVKLPGSPFSTLNWSNLCLEQLIIFSATCRGSGSKSLAQFRSEEPHTLMGLSDLGKGAFHEMYWVTMVHCFRTAKNVVACSQILLAASLLLCVDCVQGYLVWFNRKPSTPPTLKPKRP